MQSVLAEAECLPARSTIERWLHEAIEGWGVEVRMANRVSGSTRATFATGVAVCAIVLALTGCTTEDPRAIPTPSESISTPVPDSTPSPEPVADPVLIQGGTAGQNRPYVEFVIANVLQTTPLPSSLALVDALAASGFDRAAIQVTADTTRVGDPADSILFSIRIGDQCILGQVAQAALTTELADILGSGQCLVGRTLSLD